MSYSEHAHMNFSPQRTRFTKFLCFIVGVPGVLIITLGIVLYTFLSYPNKTIVIAAGPVEGFFYSTAEAYRVYLESKGFKVKIRSEQNTLSLIDLVNDQHSNVDLGFIAQDVDALNYPNTRALGVIIYEPVFVFYRRDAGAIHSLSDLKGKRIAVSPPGSGTRQMAENLLAIYGLDGQNSQFLPYNLKATAQSLMDGEVDAGVLLQPLDQPLIKELANSPGVALLDLKYGEALAQQLAARRVMKVMNIPRGYFDPRSGIPEKDLQVPAESVTVVVKKGMDPGILHHLLLAMKQVHGGAAAAATGESFPAVKGTQIPLHEVAEAYYKNGLPFLYKHLPFQMANGIFTLFLFVLPLSIVGPALSSLGVPKPLWFFQEIRCHLWLLEMQHMLSTVSSSGELSARQLRRLNRIRSIVSRQRRAVERCRDILERLP